MSLGEGLSQGPGSWSWTRLPHPVAGSGLGRSALACLVLVTISLNLAPVALGANYFIPTESYRIVCFPPHASNEEANKGEGEIDMTGDAQIHHEIVIFCFKDQVEHVNVTIPYPMRNLTHLLEYPEEDAMYFNVAATDGKALGFDVFPFSNRTVLGVKLPELVYAGDDLQFTLEYYVWGAFRPANQTYWDRQLGRGDNWRIGFIPPRQGTTSNEITIDLLVPHGFLLKRWGPGSGKKIQDHPQASVWLRWQIDQPDLIDTEYWAVFGEAGVGSGALVLLASIGVVSSIVILLIALLVRSRYGHEFLADCHPAAHPGAPLSRGWV